MDIGYYKQNEPYFGEWYITRLLGKGGYGKVFEIERKDPFSKTTYKAAMKIITVPANTQELNAARLNGMDDVSLTSYFHSMVERFVNEFDLMYKLKGNSNIVGYEDHRVVKHADGIGWDIQIKMELLTPVTEFFSNQDNSNRNNIIKLGMDMCRALEVCQSHKIIHRDIKPSNIFVSDNGDFKLGDFGVSRIKETTGTNLTKTGTIGYMAPEVYLGKTYDFSADIYSLGIVMYRLLNNNRLPFFPPISQPITVDDEEFALKSRIRGDKMSAPANADDEITKIILKACAFEPENRYSSPSEMLAELEVLANLDNNKPERFSAKVNRIKDSKINSNPEITDFVSSTCDKLENFDFETTYMKPEVYSETLQPHYDSNATTKDIPGRSLPEPDRTQTGKKKNVIIACVICAAIILAAIIGLLVYNSTSLKNKFPEKETEIKGTTSESIQTIIKEDVLRAYAKKLNDYCSSDTIIYSAFLFENSNGLPVLAFCDLYEYDAWPTPDHIYQFINGEVVDLSTTTDTGSAMRQDVYFVDGNQTIVFREVGNSGGSFGSGMQTIYKVDKDINGYSAFNTDYEYNGNIINKGYPTSEELKEMQNDIFKDMDDVLHEHLGVAFELVSYQENMITENAADYLERVLGVKISAQNYTATEENTVTISTAQSTTFTTETQSATEQVTTTTVVTPEYTVGKVVDGVYVNEWADFTIYIPDNFTYEIPKKTWLSADDVDEALIITGTDDVNTLEVKYRYDSEALKYNQKEMLEIEIEGTRKIIANEKATIIDETVGECCFGTTRYETYFVQCEHPNGTNVYMSLYIAKIDNKFSYILITGTTEESVEYMESLIKSY